MRILSKVLFFLLLSTAALAQPGPPGSPFGTLGTNIYPMNPQGALTMPQNVLGGGKGAGTINAQGLFINGVPVGTSALPSANLWVGDGTGAAQPRTPSGDLTMSNTGVFSVNNLSHVTNSSLQNSGLANPSVTVNGVTCTLGATCTITAASTGINVGTTAVTSGSANAILFNNAGTLGNVTTVANGMLSANGSGVPSFSTTLPSGLNLGTPSAGVATNLTSLNASALASGTVPLARLPGSGVTTINGTSCTIGSSCNPTAVASSMVVGTTGITSGTNSYLLYNNAGVLANTNNVSPFNVTSTGSTTARTLADRFAEVIDVLDYGAVCNGVANDTTAIQAALNAMPADGAEVVFPASFCLVDPLTLSNKTSFKLSGKMRQNSGLQLRTTGTLLTISNSHMGIIEDMTFQTGGAPQSLSPSNGLQLDTNTSNVDIDRVNFIGFKNDGLRLFGDISGQLSGNKVRNSFFLGNGGNQLYSYYSNDFHILNNQYGNLQGVTEAAVGAFLENSSAGTYQGNYHWTNTIGLKALNGSYNKYLGNRIEINLHEGAWLENDVKGTFSDNSLYSNSQAGTGTYDNLYVNGSSQLVVVGNNVFTWDSIQPRYGMNFVGTNSTLFLQSNYVTGFATSAYNFSVGTSPVGSYVDSATNNLVTKVGGSTASTLTSSGGLTIPGNFSAVAVTGTGPLTMGSNIAISHILKGANDSALSVYSDAASQVTMEAFQASNAANKYTLYLNKYGGTTQMGGPTTLNGALTYGGVQLNNAVTGTGNMVLSDNPTVNVTATGSTTARSLQNRFAETINTLDYGASPSNTASQNRTAFQAATTAACSASAVYKTITIPAGSYSVDVGTSTPFAINCTGVSISGAGVEATLLLPSGNGILFHYTAPAPNPYGGVGTISGIRTFRNDNPTSSTTLRLEEVQAVTLENIQFDGDYTSIDFYSALGIRGTNLISIGNNTNTGSAFWRFREKTSGKNNSEIFLSNFNLRAGTIGSISNAIVIGNSDGIFLSNGHVGFSTNEAVLVQASTTTSPLYNIIFTGVSFDSAQYGARFVATGGYTLAPGVIQFVGGNCELISEDCIRVDDTTVDQLLISGVNFHRNNKRAINIQGGHNYTITGNNFYRSNDANGGYSHILIGGATNNVAVSGNTFETGTGGTAVPYDVVVANTADDVSIAANQHKGATSGAVSQTTSGTNVKVYSGNAWYLPNTSMVMNGAAVFNGGLTANGASTIFTVSGTSNPQMSVVASNVAGNGAGYDFSNTGQRNWQIWADRTTDKLSFGHNSRGTTVGTLDPSGNMALIGKVTAVSPTSCSGQPTGTFWNNGGVVNVCP